MSTDYERRLKELEAEVQATRAKSAPRPGPPPVAVRPSPAVAPEEPPKKKGWFSSWKTKLLVVGGAVAAGVVALWVVGKLVKLALYVGLAAAVGFAVWWFFFRKRS